MEAWLLLIRHLIIEVSLGFSPAIARRVGHNRSRSPSPPLPRGGEREGGRIRFLFPTIMGLLKQRSWSPDSDREEAWLRRQSIHRGRRGRLALARARSVTDEDLDELRGCIDLGFGFDAESPLADARRLSDTLPALDLYYTVHRGSPAGSPPSESSSSDGSAASPDLGSTVSFFSPGDSPEERKARLKQWAQVVACSLRQRC
ncbi:unnamed protein product [Musa hybrid cultivar]